MEGPGGKKITSVEEMYGRFSSEIVNKLPAWRQTLHENPDDLEPLEKDVHAFFARGADLIVAGVIAVVMASVEHAKTSEQTRKEFEYPLAKGRDRTIAVKLLGGLVMWICSLYCEPRKSVFRKLQDNRSGLYTEMVQFGFAKDVSPALQSRVARQAALCPSLQLASDELQRQGVALDTKTVRRIAQQCGEGLLQVRKRKLLQWRAGKLAAGHELAGKRVAVQIDGGRTKIRGQLQKVKAVAPLVDEDGLMRENAPGRSRAKPRRSFQAEWREPKLVIIFAYDEQGRLDPKTKVTIEGTFEGPDAITELVAMHLHQLGAAHAESITFVADGALWIWDRIERIAELAKLGSVPRYEVLDCCHAVHHISLALAALGLGEADRRPLYREHRSLLRNGQWRRVVEELADLAAGVAADNTIHREIAYLRKHGEAGRLRYPWYRGEGIPIGSGSIESSIRRVVNLRLKGNGVFWLADGAESMLQLRSQVVSDRWDERVKELRSHQRRYGKTDWRWEPEKMTQPTEPNSEPPKKSLKSQ